MATDILPGEKPGQLEALLDRWQASLDLHARYAALDDARYWHVQPWPRHERPQRWIIQLARKRILALKRSVAQRTIEGDRAFIEGIETMGFLATLVGLTSVERFIPLATPETERREVLAAKPEPARAGETRRTAETTRQMPALPNPRVAVRAGAPAAPAARAPSATVPTRAPSATVPTRAPSARREPRRDPQRPATIKPKKAPSTITQSEHVVIADAVRLLGWGRLWHELAEMIARLAERPAPSEIRRILRTYRDHIDAIVSRRQD
ncbi:MAG TPA: hypothetical protein VFP37_04430 [Steroidobacteraceae bacterium]|nr:hypothetical protein [Steroidobacteraceae bacterium]